MDTSALEKKITMKLIDNLIKQMDDHEMGEYSSEGSGEMMAEMDGEGEPIAIMEEKKAMPLSDAKDEIADKIQSAMDGEETGGALSEEDDDSEKPMFSGFMKGKRY